MHYIGNNEVQYRLINFSVIGDSRGSLVSLEGSRNIPFDITRLYPVKIIDTNRLHDVGIIGRWRLDRSTKTAHESYLEYAAILALDYVFHENGSVYVERRILGSEILVSRELYRWRLDFCGQLIIENDAGYRSFDISIRRFETWRGDRRVNWLDIYGTDFSARFTRRNI